MFAKVREGLGTQADSPLLQYVHFLLRTLEYDAAPLFTLLRSKYKASLNRDPTLDAYVSMIGERFYGIKAPKQGLAAMMDMMGRCEIAAAGAPVCRTNREGG